MLPLPLSLECFEVFPLVLRHELLEAVLSHALDSCLDALVVVQLPAT